MFNPECGSREDEPQNNVAEKEKQWQAKEKEIDETTDALGYRIDKGIKDTVVSLNVVGLNTSQSCEGHVDRGRISPYIDIEAPNQPEERFVGEKDLVKKTFEEFGITDELLKRIESGTASEEDINLYIKAKTEAYNIVYRTLTEETPQYKEWDKQNEGLYKRCREFLDDFYKDRKVPENERIIIDEDWHDRFSIYNGGEDYYSQEKDRTEEEKEQLSERLKLYQQEMQLFAEFLKTKFLEK